MIPNDYFFKQIIQFEKYVTENKKYIDNIFDEYHSLMDEYHNSIVTDVSGFLYNGCKKRQKINNKLESIILNNLRNEEYSSIIEKFNINPKNPELMNWFAKWINNIDNMYYLYTNYIDPLFLNDENIECKTLEKERLIIFNLEGFGLKISFENSSFKKTDVSLFDTITGLDKENITFIKIMIINKSSNNTYEYSYVKNGKLSSSNIIDEEIEISQLEYIRNETNKYMINIINILFDKIINKNRDKYIDLYNGNFLNNEVNKKKWLAHTITGLMKENQEE